MESGVPPDMALLQTVARLEQQLSLRLEELEEARQQCRQLEKAQLTLQMMIENVDDLIAVTDRQGRRVWNNPAYHRVLGYDPEEMVGTDASGEIHPDDRDIVGRAFREAMNQGVCSRIEYRMRHRQGHWITLESQARTVNDSQGNPQYLVIVARDISSRKLEQEEQAKANRMNAMAVIAQGLAQEYNDVISSILFNLEQARQNAPHGSIVASKIYDAERAAAQAEEVTMRINEMIQQENIEKTPLNLDGAVYETCLELTRETIARPEFAFSPQCPTGLVNEPAFRRVVRNLVLNAIEAMRSRGIIRIALDPFLVDPRDPARAAGLAPGLYARLEIRDQGAGIAHNHVNKIFEPYFTTKEGHTGLGLTTALSIAKNHGGTIIIQTTDNVGTTATVFFPAADQPVIEEAPKPLAAPAASVTGRILIMDDEKMTADFLQMALTKQGYKVETVPEGAHAISKYLDARAQGQPFDVVILDLQVAKGMGGMDALAALRQFDGEVRAILGTTKTAGLDLDHPERYGAWAIIKKPYTAAVMSDVLTRVMPNQLSFSWPKPLSPDSFSGEG